MTNVFYQLSLKKALRFSPIFIFRFCRDNFVKLLKIRTVNLFLLPANSALRMFAVKSEKNLQSNIMVLYRSHHNTIIFQIMKCVPSLQETDADLHHEFFHTQLSPNKIKRTPIFLMYHSLTASHMQKIFCLHQDTSFYEIHFSVLNDYNYFGLNIALKSTL